MEHSDGSQRAIYNCYDVDGGVIKLVWLSLEEGY